MKFKATLEEPRAFLAVLQICRSIQRDCIVRLQSSRTRFLTSADVLDGVQVWMGCRTDYLFSDFRCDSHYKERSITCEIMGVQQLMHILKQADVRQHGSRVNRTSIRLARSGNKPIFKLTMQSASQYLPDLSYDVPIRILSDREIEGMQAPPLEDDHIQVVIPNLFELSTFVDKMKSSACDSATFSARGYSVALSGGDRASDGGSSHKRPRGGSGEAGPRLATFQVYAENFLASFTLKYDAVEMIPRPPGSDRDEEDEARSSRRHTTPGREGVEESNEDDDDDDGEGRAASVSVEVRKLARFLSTVKEINPTRLSLYLVDQRALVLSVQASGNTTMVAYIPAKKD